MAHLGHSVGDYVAGSLGSGHQTRADEHLLGCVRCRILVARERQRLQLLQGGSLLEPSDDLAQRILQRTRCLNTPGNEALRLPYRVRRRTRRALAAAAAAAAVAVLGAAYLAGDDGATGPVPPSTTAAGLTGRWPVENPATLTAPAATAQLAAVVRSTDIDRLKKSGWACPELDSMGFTLRSAEGFVLAGVPTLELTLSNGANTVTVFEQRPQRGAPAGGSGVPLNAMTGHDAATDGFAPLSAGGLQLWLHQGHPWQVIFRKEDATYTVSTDLPAAALARMTAVISAPASAAAAANGGGSGPGTGPGTAGQPADGNWITRIVRGLGRLASLG